MSSLTSIDPEKKLRSHCPQFTSVQIHHIMCMHLLKIEKEGKNNLAIVGVGAEPHGNLDGAGLEGWTEHSPGGGLVRGEGMVSAWPCSAVEAPDGRRKRARTSGVAVGRGVAATYTAPAGDGELMSDQETGNHWREGGEGFVQSGEP
jgi:hypothetical protein